MLGTLLPSGTVSANLADPPTVGTLYMQALAQSLFNAVKTNALDKGAQRIALLNMPDITHTPRFQMVLAGIEAQQGAIARAQSPGTVPRLDQRFQHPVGHAGGG